MDRRIKRDRTKRSAFLSKKHWSTLPLQVRKLLGVSISFINPGHL